MIDETIPAGYRKCHDCGLMLPETAENFLLYWSKKEQRYYYKSHCRACGKIRSKRWRDENSTRYKEYYTAKNKTAENKEADHKFKATHKDQIAEYKREYRATHKEQIAEYDRSRRETQEGREHANAMTRSWRANNREAVAEYNRRYAQENKEYFVQATHKRNARKKQLTSSLTLEEWEAIKAEFNYKCAYCGKLLKRLTQDHFIPLTAGGEYTKENIIPACKSCNSSKHTSIFNEWYRRQNFYSKEREAHILSYIESQKEGAYYGA